MTHPTAPKTCADSKELCEPGDCRSRIVQAAKEVFVEEGYQASIDKIAVRADVARQTLYNHFANKSELFAEVIRRATDILFVSLEDDGQSVRVRLQRFGLAYRSRVLNADGLGLFRILVAESQRFPEVVKAAYSSGPIQTAFRVAEVLRSAAQRGEIRLGDEADALFAARLLLSMLVGAERTHYLLSGDPLPAPDPALVARIVDAFLRAYGSDTTAETYRTTPQLIAE